MVSYLALLGAGGSNGFVYLLRLAYAVMLKIYLVSTVVSFAFNCLNIFGDWNKIVGF